MAGPRRVTTSELRVSKRTCSDEGAARPVYNQAMINSLARWLWLPLGAALLAGCASGVTPTVPPSTPGPTAFVDLQVVPVPTEAQVSLPAVPTAICSNDAEFLEDLTLPDGTKVLPGAELDKRWLILNRGGCGWGSEYRLVQIGDSRIQGPRELALYPAVAGGQATWQVPLVAPLEEGEYISRWQAQAPDGAAFGDEVYVLIVVDASPLTPTPIPTAPRP